MTPEPILAEHCAKCAETARRCAKLLRSFTSDLITFDEFAYNAEITMIELDDACKRSCLQSLPEPTVAQIADHLNSLLTARGTMPLVRPFVVDFNDEQEIQSRKQQIEPRIQELVQALTDTASAPR